jgi:hypothetical protein
MTSAIASVTAASSASQLSAAFVNSRDPESFPSASRTYIVAAQRAPSRRTMPSIERSASFENGLRPSRRVTRSASAFPSAHVSLPSPRTQTSFTSAPAARATLGAATMAHATAHVLS